MDYTGATEIQMQRIVSTLAGDDRILAAYLLGSAARDALRPESDLDIAVMPADGYHFTALELAELAAQLTPLAGRPVDIGLISPANLVYARQAILTGRRIVCRNLFHADRTAATLLGLAAQFEYERREVVHAYSR